MDSRRSSITIALVFVFVIGFLHLRPLLAWTFRVGPALAAEAHAERVRIRTVTEFSDAPERWGLLRTGNLSLRAPLLQDETSTCRACSGSCILEFASGSLTVLPETGPASYTAAVTTFTPDVEDLSPWRWSWDNWRTLDALEARVRGGDELPDAFRFEAAGSRGIVTVHLTGGTARVLVYAYAEDGSPARAIGLTGVDRSDAERLLGTLRVEPAATARAIGDCDDDGK